MGTHDPIVVTEAAVLVAVSVVTVIVWEAHIGRTGLAMAAASCLVFALVAVDVVRARAARRHLTKTRAAMAALAAETAHRRQVERELAEEEIARLRAEYDTRSALQEQRRLREVAERQRVETELWKARRLEGLGHLAGGIAHDFNNVLQIIHNASELARAHAESLGGGAARTGAAVASDLDLIDDATEQARRMIRQVLTFTGDEGEIEPLDVVEATARAETVLAGLLGPTIDMRLELAPDVPPVAIDRARYEQLLLNLVVNARDAMNGSGRLGLSVDRLAPHDTSVERVRLRVTDTGTGIADEILDQLFDPFFTTKETGTGLGLSTVFNVVDGAGGTIGVASTGPTGTTFEVVFPAVPVADRSRGDGPAPAGDISIDGLTILVVDDDAILLEVAGRLLALAGCEVITARSGAEAIALAERHRGRIDVVLTDYHMPGLDGTEVSSAMATLLPDAAVVVMSGSGDLDVNDGTAPPNVLGKPFGQAELRAAIAAAATPRRGALTRTR